MTEEYKKIIVVDENNENPRAVSYEEAIQNNLIRRGSRVLVVREDNQLLIARRSRHVAEPCLFGFSAAGHVDEGEEYIDAALRELKEEIGIEALPESLTELPEVEERNMFAKSYVLKVANDVEIQSNDSEIDEYFWFTKNDLNELISNEPDTCTESLVLIWLELRDSIIPS